MEKVSVLILSLVSLIMSTIEGFQPAIYSPNPIWVYIIISTALASIILSIININKQLNKKISVVSIVISLISIIIIGMCLTPTI